MQYHPVCAFALAAVEERSFHGSSRHLALLFAVAYCAWLLLVRRNFGKVGARPLHSLPPPGSEPGVSAWGWRPPARLPAPPAHDAGMPTPTSSDFPVVPQADTPPTPPCRPQFPYPILNKLPFPGGFLGFVVLGFAVVLATFQLGKAVKTLANSLFSSSSSGVADADAGRARGEGKKGR